MFLMVMNFHIMLNLMEFTDKEVVESGVKIVQEVADEKSLKFENYLVLFKFENVVPDGLQEKRRKVLKYFLNKPWEVQDKVYHSGI